MKGLVVTVSLLSFLVLPIGAMGQCTLEICDPGGIPAPEKPFQVALAPRLNVGFVTGRNTNDGSPDDYLHKIDLCSDEVVQTRNDVGDYPLGLAVTPDESMVLACMWGSNQVWALDTGDLSTIAQIDVGAGPTNIVVNSTGSTAYVTCDQSGEVDVIDLLDLQVLQGLTVGTGGAGVWGVQLSNDDSRLYVGAYEDQTVYIYYTDGGLQLADQIPVSFPHLMGFCLSPDEQALYICAHEADYVAKYYIPTHAWMYNIPTGAAPFSITYSDALDGFLVSNSLANSVSFIRSDDTLDCTVPVSTQPNHITIHPSGMKAYVAHGIASSVAVLCFPSLICRAGSTSGQSLCAPATLYVNGTPGDWTRTTCQEEGRPILASITRPPSGGNGKFVVHANLELPTPSTTTVLPFQIGRSCFDFLLAPAGGAHPDAIWNNLGKRSVLGWSRYFDGSGIPDPERAPVTFLDLPGGDPVYLPAGSHVMFQGLVVDPGSAAQKMVSITNAVLLQVL